MKDFGKLLRIFNYKNEYLCDYNSITLVSNKYKSLIKTYTSESCPNFIQETSSFIYILDKKLSIAKSFMEDTIEKDIQSSELINKIYLYLSSNYKDLSNNVIDCITNYFIKKNNSLKGETILFLLKKLNSLSIIKEILNKIDNFIIKEEEIFSDEKEIESFILLKGIQNEGLFEKQEKLKDTKYLMSSISLGQKILKYIKKGEIKYNIFNSLWKDEEKRKILKERLNILLFNNEKDINDCIESFKKYIIPIKRTIAYLEKLSKVLKTFYIKSHEDDIKLLDDLEKKIKNGMLNEINKEETKENLEKIKIILPDLDKKYKLLSSCIFLYFFEFKKAADNLRKEDDIFNETEKDFDKLEQLFEENWTTKIG